MSFRNPYNRNISNSVVFTEIYASSIIMQSSGNALTIYGSDNTTAPVYTFNPYTQSAVLTGDVTITGELTVNSIVIDSIAGGLFGLAEGNAADILDIGIYGQYSTTNYTGVIRDASDSLKRWTFFQNITTVPTSVISGIDSTKLASILVDKIYVNDGTVTTPSIAFDSETGKYTGFYKHATNIIGIAAAGTNIMKVGSTDVEFADNITVDIGVFGNYDGFLRINGLSEYHNTLRIRTGGWYTTNFGCLYVAPNYTTDISDSGGNDNWYFSYFEAPPVSGTTTGALYNVYIAGPPTGGTAAASYSLYVLTGLTRVSSFIADGLITASVGINVNNGQTLNVGSSGTTSQANIYGNLYVAGGTRGSITISNASNIALTLINYILETTLSGVVVVTLPDINVSTGATFIVIKTGATGTTTVNTISSQTIDDGVTTSLVLTNQYDRVTIIGGSTQWYTI